MDGQLHCERLNSCVTIVLIRSHGHKTKIQIRLDCLAWCSRALAFYPMDAPKPLTAPQAAQIAYANELPLSKLSSSTPAQPWPHVHRAALQPYTIWGPARSGLYLFRGIQTVIIIPPLPVLVELWLGTRGRSRPLYVGFVYLR